MTYVFVLAPATLRNYNDVYYHLELISIRISTQSHLQMRLGKRIACINQMSLEHESSFIEVNIWQAVVVH